MQGRCVGACVWHWLVVNNYLCRVFVSACVTTTICRGIVVVRLCNLLVLYIKSLNFQGVCTKILLHMQ